MVVKIIRRSEAQARAVSPASPANGNERSARLTPVPSTDDVRVLPAPAPTACTEAWDGAPSSELARRRPATLATILEAVAASSETARAKRDMSWAIRTFARATGRTPSDILADAPTVRNELSTMSPAMLGLDTESAFYNVTSLMRKALRIGGKSIRPRARSAPLKGAWVGLFASLPGRSAKARLGGFISFCSANGYEPADVSDGHLARYAHVLETDSLDPAWIKKVEKTVVAWNKAVADLPLWPKTPLKSPWKRKAPFTPPAEALPQLYQDSMRDFLDYCQNPHDEDEFVSRKGLRPGSIRTRYFLLRYMAEVLRQAGWDDKALSSVNDLVTPRALDVLLRHQSPQPDGTGRAQYLVRVVVLKSIAKYWAAAPNEVITQLSRIINRYSAKTHSMTPANRRKLSAVSGADVRVKLFTLAARVYQALDGVRPEDLTERCASLALAALYVELSLMWPGRVGTLSKIHLTKNLVRSGRGRTERMFLHFQKSEIKNGVEVDVELPPHLVALIKLYLNRYRSLLTKQPSDYLGGGPQRRRRH
jgi:hypothetical protein